MRYILFLAVILSAFYISATQLLLQELNSIKTIYENAETIAQNINTVKTADNQ